MADRNVATDDTIEDLRSTYNSTSMRMNKMPSVVEQAFEGYHLYEIPFKISLANNEKTQIRVLLAAKNFYLQQLEKLLVEPSSDEKIKFS